MSQDRSQSPDFRFRVFGGPELFRGKFRIRLTRYQGWLLSLLAFQSLPGISRERILGYFWLRGRESVLRRRLSQLIYSLYVRAGNQRVVRIEASLLSLNPVLVGSDLTLFEDALESDDPSHAVSLLERGPLVGLERPPTPSLETWAKEQAQSVHARTRKATGRALANSLHRSEWPLVEKASAALLQLDPTDPEALRHLVRALCMQGRPCEAKSALQSFERDFAKHDPRVHLDSATNTLLSTLNEQILTLAKTDIAAGFLIPLVGREEEMSQLSNFFPPRGLTQLQVVSLMGVSGSGKTRLAEEALQLLYGEDVEVIRTRCLSAQQSVPFSTIQQALATESVGSAISALPRCCRAALRHLLHGGQSFTDASTSRAGGISIIPSTNVCEAVRRAITDVAKNRPLVILIDDYHLIDESSRCILTYVQSRGIDGSVILFLAGEVTADDDARVSLAAEHNSEARSSAFGRRELRLFARRLSTEDVGRLVNKWVERDLQRNVVDELLIVSSGLPKYIAPVYDAIRDQYPKVDRQEFTAGLLGPIILARMSNLGNRSVALLRLLALARERLTLADLARCLEVGGQTAARALNVLASMGWVDVAPRGIALACPVLETVVSRSVPPGTEVLLHSRLAELFESKGASSPASVALHRLRTGDLKLALPYILRATREAERVGDYADHLRVLECAAATATDPSARMQVLRQLGRVQCKAGVLGRGTEALAEAARIGIRLGAGEGDTLEARVSILEAKASDPERDSGALASRASTLQARARQLRRLDLVARLNGQLLHLCDELGDVSGFRTTLALANSVVRRPELADQEKLPFHLLSCAQLHLARPERVSGRIARTASLAQQVGDAQAHLSALNWELIALYHRGDLNREAGIRSRRKGLEAARACGDHTMKFQHALNCAVWYLDILDLEGAEVAFETARALLGDSTAPQWRRRLLFNLGELALARQNLEEAEEFFFQAFSLSPRVATDQGRMLSVAGLGLTALAEGDRECARRWLLQLPGSRRFWTVDPTLILRFKLAYERGRPGYNKVVQEAHSIARKVWYKSLPWRLRLSLLFAEHMEGTESLFNRHVSLQLLEEIQKRNLGEIERRFRVAFRR